MTSNEHIQQNVVDKQVLADLVGLRRYPSVVRLDALQEPGAQWISDHFFASDEIAIHLQALGHAFDQPQGQGMFLIGHYGSGKSHFLAFVAQQLSTGANVHFKGLQCFNVITLSLLNYSAQQPLEEIVAKALGLKITTGDRRDNWLALHQGGAAPTLLIIDELSEFLRAKPDQRQFTEDIRFLQYMGEWAQCQPFWLLCAMQEQIEHTGDLEYSLYRKIKDRFPLRLLLSATQIKALIAQHLLLKKPGYHKAVAQSVEQLQQAFPNSRVDYNVLADIYPLHPATLDLLEEVRDRFSQTRGMVDFTVTQLAGDKQRGISPFLDRPWGDLLTPDYIIDHFRDLFELQPEFQSISQRFLAYYQEAIPQLFDNARLQEVAEKVIKLLILVYLSPKRSWLSVEEAAWWLLYRVTQIDSQRNIKVISKVLHTLHIQGRYIQNEGQRYGIDLKADVSVLLESMVEQEFNQLPQDESLIHELIAKALAPQGFNPFSLPLLRWQSREQQWHFHPRRYATFLGNETPPLLERSGGEFGLVLRLPWGESGLVGDNYQIIPSAIVMSDELKRLAALLQCRRRSLNPDIEKRLQKQLTAGMQLYQSQIKTAWLEAKLLEPDGRSLPLPGNKRETIDALLEGVVLWVLRKRYPSFEHFAPGHGPLPKAAYLHYSGYLQHESADCLDYYRLLNEAYLLPLELVQRREKRYRTHPRYERQEIVSALMPMLAHEPSPQRLQAHFAEPIYGLVADQINVILLFLLQQGEIDLKKGRHSYRDYFETLPNPSHYDKVVLAQGLAQNELLALEALLKSLSLPIPKQWALINQKQAIERLRDIAGIEISRIEPVALRLLDLNKQLDQNKQSMLYENLLQYQRHWQVLADGEDALPAWQQFLFELGSVDAFQRRYHEMQNLPKQVERLLTEIQRYQHLFEQPSIAALDDESIAFEFSELQQAPLDANIEQWQQWLLKVSSVYQKYREVYGQKHQQWWDQCLASEDWQWQPPNVAHSCHLGLSQSITEWQAARTQLQPLKCQGLVDMQYQAICRCGFDGARVQLVEDCLSRLAKLRTNIESTTHYYFQQSGVKEKMAQWKASGVECNAKLLAYLDNKSALPEVENLQVLDQHLSGLSVVRELDVDDVVALLSERTWQPEILMEMLQQYLHQFRNERIKFNAEKNTDSDELHLWTIQQALKYGEAIPDTIKVDISDSQLAALRPELLAEAALLNVEQLNLPPTLIKKIIGWFLAGDLVGLEVELGKQLHTNSLLEAAHWLRPHGSLHHGFHDAEKLTAVCESLYQHQSLLMSLDRQAFLSGHENIVNAHLKVSPKPLVKVLEQEKQAQWLVLDCFGVTLLRQLQPMLENTFKYWQLERLEFAEADASTTEGFYASLLDKGVQHTFEKVNLIDELIHQRQLNHDELAKIASTELGLVLAKRLKKFDSKQSILVFSDHGFRLAKNGRGFIHGGISYLERLVPVLRFVPR